MAPCGQVTRLASASSAIWPHWPCYRLPCCLADSLAHQPFAGTGTVMRPDTLREHGLHAGFSRVDVLDVQNDFYRFLAAAEPHVAGVAVSGGSVAASLR